MSRIFPSRVPNFVPRPEKKEGDSKAELPSFFLFNDLIVNKLVNN